MKKERYRSEVPIKQHPHSARSLADFRLTAGAAEAILPPNSSPIYSRLIP